MSTFQDKTAYAEIYCNDASAAQNIPTGTTYTKITAFTNNGEAVNCTADAANDKITITKAGVYKISGSFSLTSDTNNVVYRGAVFVNGVEQNEMHWHRKIATGADVGSTSFTGLVTISTVPYDVDFRLRHDNGGTVAVTFTYVNINVIRV